MLERLWRRLEHDAMLRGALEARFETLPAGGARLSVTTAYEADGERRIEKAMEQLRRAVQGMVEDFHALRATRGNGGRVTLCPTSKSGVGDRLAARRICIIGKCDPAQHLPPEIERSLRGLR